MSLLSGKCLCGAVRYEITSEPAFTGNCHCADCKKASGSGYAPTIFVPEEAISISGQVKFYENTGDSGKPVRRGFCPQCGSQLFGKPAMLEGLIGVRAGTLDDVSQYHPHVDIYVKNAPAWDVMNPNIPHFPELPPA